jgi:HK97 family phage portal protein
VYREKGAGSLRSRIDRPKRTGKNDWEKVDSHPALEPFMDPNPWDDAESFLRTWIASENIAGEFYAEIVRSNAGIPVQLYPLRPDCITPQYRYTAKGQVLDYYSYQINGFEVRYKPEELLIRRRHGLGSMYSGTSPLSIALGPVDADISATEYIRAFYNNGGTPSGILTVKGKKMTKEEIDHMAQSWSANFARQGKRRGGTAVLDESAEYQSVGSNLDQLNSESLTSIDETRICMAFGVPPVIIGAFVGLKNVNQKASFKGAMEEFWMNTMSPELKALRKFLTRKWLPMFGEEEAVKRDQIRFFWDIQNVEALQEDVDNLHDRIALGYKSGIYKLNEARAKVGLDAVDDVIGEEFYKPTPADLNDPANTDVPPKKHDVLDADLLEKKNFELRREMSPAEMMVDIKAIFDSYERGTNDLTAVIQDIRQKLIIQAVEEATQIRDKVIHELTLAPPKQAYQKVRGPIERAVNEGRRQIMADAAKAKRFIPIVSKGLIDDLIQRLVDLTISRIVGEVASAASNIIAALGILGLDRNEIDDRLTAELKDRSDKPFEIYARQAINSAVNAGRREEMQDRADDIRLYEYSAILDKNVCGPCEEWDGKQASDDADLPETPNPECEGGANCRCFIIAIFEGEAQ